MKVERILKAKANELASQPCSEGEAKLRGEFTSIPFAKMVRLCACKFVCTQLVKTHPRTATAVARTCRFVAPLFLSYVLFYIPMTAPTEQLVDREKRTHTHV